MTSRRRQHEGETSVIRKSVKVSFALAARALEGHTGGTMADVLDPQYRSARAALDELHGADFSPLADPRVDELMAFIEDYEGSMRFVPEWPDESFKHAA